jgi:hypothetical protein
VHWARLPEELTRWSKKAANTKSWNVHAKVYRLFRGGRSRADWREIQVVGSVNLTGAAHAGDTQRNFETAMLVELPCQHEPDWWMRRLSSLPPEFIGRKSEDDTGTLACHELTLQYDWQEGVLKYFWKAEPKVPPRAKITANGCPLFDIESVSFDQRCELDATAAAVLRGHLTSSSLVELVIVDGELPQPLLVQELNMARKPSLLDQLTAAEILEYWSLLPRKDATNIWNANLPICWSVRRGTKKFALRLRLRSRSLTILRGFSSPSPAWRSMFWKRSSAELRRRRALSIVGGEL